MSGKAGVKSDEVALVREHLDLPNHIPYQLNYVSSILELGVSRLFQTRFGLGIREWRVLAILGNNGPSSASDMLAWASLDKATVSRAISTLEQQGFVARRRHPDDARRQLVYLTKKGAALHDRVAPVSRMRQRVFEAALTPDERKQLRTILGKLRAQVEWLNAEEANDSIDSVERSRKHG